MADIYREICRRVDKFRILFLFAVAMLAMMLPWLPFITPGTGTYVVVIMNVVGAAGFAVFAGFFVWWCRKRREKRREEERAPPDS